MGTTSEKLTYLNETKQKLKQAINNIGGEVTDETTFRQYANQLQNVYDNLPKTEYQEGTEVNLGKTSKGKLDYENGVVGIGQTEQAIDLTENNLTSQSVNGLTITVNTDKSITINGTASSLTVINLLNNTASNYGTEATARTLQVGTYSLTGCPSGSDEGSKFKIDVVRSGYAILVDTGNGNIVDVTSIQTYTFFRIVIYNGVVCNNLVFRPKLLKIPSPSYPQTINSVTGNQDVVVSGKNLIYSQSKNGDILFFNGTTSYDDADFGAGTYTLSYEDENTCLVVMKEEGGSLVSLGNVKLATFTATKNFNIWLYRSGITANEVTKAQLEQGSVTTYEPYQTPQTYQLSLGDIELNAIGNYKDELIYDVDEDKVYKYARVGEVTLNGSEDWIASTLYIGNYYTRSVVSNANEYETNLKCNLTKNFLSSANQLNSYENAIMFDGGPLRNVNFKNSQIGNVENLKTFLSSTNLIIYYVLATPTLTEITDTTLKAQVKAWYNAHSLNGTTIITSNGNLPMIIKVRGLKGE